MAEGKSEIGNDVALDALSNLKHSLLDGETTEVTAERIVFSAETADMFERAYASQAVGNALLKPQPIDAWVTYNFEVEEHHTYVAGGVRVHNESGARA